MDIPSIFQDSPDPTSPEFPLHGDATSEPPDGEDSHGPQVYGTYDNNTWRLYRNITYSNEESYLNLSYLIYQCYIDICILTIFPVQKKNMQYTVQYQRCRKTLRFAHKIRTVFKHNPLKCSNTYARRFGISQTTKPKPQILISSSWWYYSYPCEKYQSHYNCSKYIGNIF